MFQVITAQSATTMAAVNHVKNSAMEADTISKHGRSSTSQKGRGKVFIMVCLALFSMIASVAFSTGNAGLNNAVGYLTITGLSKFNNKYVVVSGCPLDGYERKIENETFFIRISGGQARVPLFLDQRCVDAGDTFTGSEEVRFGAIIYNEPSYKEYGEYIYPLGATRFTVTLNRGNATVNWPNDYHLTITGLSEFNGKYVLVMGCSGFQNDCELFGFAKINEDDKMVLVRISGGQVKVPLFTDYGSFPFTGVAKEIGSISVRIFNEALFENYDDAVATRHFENVAVTNSNITVAWRNGISYDDE